MRPGDQSNVPPMKEPPSVILKKFHQSLKGKNLTEVEIEETARKVLLPVHEVKIWLEHLSTVDTNRRRGAAKAAETRRKKLPAQSVNVQESSEPATYCGICGALFEDTEESEYWIGCESCVEWFHGECVNITKETEPDEFYCFACI